MKEYKQYVDWQQFMNYQKYMGGSRISWHGRIYSL